MNLQTGDSLFRPIPFIAMTNGKSKPKENYVKFAVNIAAGGAPNAWIVVSERYLKDAGIKVAPNTIRSWMRQWHMRNVHFVKVYWLAKMSHVPMHMLTGTEDLCPKKDEH